MEKLENKNLKIVWINGEALIDLAEVMPPRMNFRVVQIPLNGKDPFKQMLDEMRKFMGGLDDNKKK
jgi:hypothetical protein